MQKVVIVTGGSGGLGGEIATQFGLNGARVLVHYSSRPDYAEEVAAKINRGCGEAFTYQADICNYTQLEAMVDTVLDKWQRIDVLINSAGGGVFRLGSGNQSIINMDEATWDRIIDINLKGTLLCIKAVAAHMIDQKNGHIINVSSGTGLSGKAGRSAYAAAKAGIFGLTKSAARELADYNIKVNAVCPGLIFHEHSARTGRSPDPTYKEENLLHRVSGDAKEFAQFVVHLSTMENMSGQTLNLDSRILF